MPLLRRLLLAVLLVAATFATSGRPANAQAGGELPWPDRRFAPCGAVDPEAGALYAFGGRADDDTTHLSDLWALDLGDGRHERPVWSLAAPAGALNAPPPVRTCAAAWEPSTDRLLVFGGWNGSVHDGVLRAFDPATGSWSVVCDATSCGAGPSARRASQLLVDEAGARGVLFGGTNGPYLDDLWVLDLATMTWQRVTTPGPISRGGHSMALAPDGTSVWLFGGTRPGADLADVWRLDLATLGWSEIDPACLPGCPSPRSGATLVADPIGDRLVLYGGVDSSGSRRDVWLLDHLGGQPTWSLLEPASEAPQARSFHVARYDATALRMVVFGGGANGSAYKDALGLTMPTRHRPAAWHSLSPTTPITARDQVTMVLADGVITAFGGFGSGTFPGTIGAGTHLSDTWQRTIGRKGRWHLATPTNATRVPTAREGTAYALDEDGRRLLMFGGLTGDTVLSDVWVADVSRPGRPRWEQLCAAMSCGAGPLPRWGGHAAYDPAGDRLVVFGGLTAGGVTTNDVWALDLSGEPDWTELSVDGARPVARWSAAYGFDPVGRRLVVFGGQTGPDASGTSLADAWALSLDGAPAWTELGTAGAAPAARRSPAGAVRVTSDGAELIVATGYTPSTGEHHDDVWSLDLTDDTASWVELDAGGGPGDPAPRRSASAVYDVALDRLVMAFGRDDVAFNDELWSFNLVSGNWTQIPG